MASLLFLALVTACAHGRASSGDTTDTVETADTDACPKPADVSECVPTTGDHCSCAPQCLTGCQLDRIEAYCDTGCPPDVDWTCHLDEHGDCAPDP